MVDAFFLEVQRNHRKNALTADPAKGKTGKKLYFSPHCGDETTTYSNRAFFNEMCWEGGLKDFPFLSRNAAQPEPLPEKGAEGGESLFKAVP